MLTHMVIVYGVPVYVASRQSWYREGITNLFRELS